MYIIDNAVIYDTHTVRKVRRCICAYKSRRSERDYKRKVYMLFSSAQKCGVEIDSKCTGHLDYLLKKAVNIESCTSTLIL